MTGGGSFEVGEAFLAGWASVAGPHEAEGPLGAAFDEVWSDELNGEDSWERAERALSLEALDRAATRAAITREDLDAVLAGDLLDQLYATNFAGRDHQRPLLGLFAACATFTEGIGLAALLLGNGGPRALGVVASSHHLAAERQFRFPVEFGYQRPLTASWTATAAGAVVVSRKEGPVRVRSVTWGRVTDRGSKNPMDMGTAMAPAAHDTISRHLQFSGHAVDDYDRIVTGDLGHVGSAILQDLMGNPEGWQKRHDDCGRSLYHERQDSHNGGSGAGCVAAVTCARVLPELAAGRWRRVLVVATGALFSPTSYQQGETIPCIAHAVELEAVEG